MHVGNHCRTIEQTDQQGGGRRREFTAQLTPTLPIYCCRQNPGTKTSSEDLRPNIHGLHHTLLVIVVEEVVVNLGPVVDLIEEIVGMDYWNASWKI